MDASPTTRALMERDMLVRKFQKENLDDLFAVIRQNPSGMQCLARFAGEQRMGGEVGFFMDVKGDNIGSSGRRTRAGGGGKSGVVDRGQSFSVSYGGEVGVR